LEDLAYLSLLDVRFFIVGSLQRDYVICRRRRVVIVLGDGMRCGRHDWKLGNGARSPGVLEIDEADQEPRGHILA
jgi:hypothetical protein